MAVAKTRKATTKKAKPAKKAKAPAPTRATVGKAAGTKDKTPDTAALEAAYLAKWPHIDLVPGSYRLAGALDHSPTKHSVELRCASCRQPFRRATQDAWESRVCSPACKRALKKATK
jgi:hypothetical protein